MMSVGEVPHQLTFLERVDGGGTNLEKLNQLSRIIRLVVAGKVSTKSGLADVKSLNDAPSEYGPGLMTCAYTLACGTSAVFFSGGWLEIAIASIIGLVLGLFSLVAERHPRVAGVVPVFGALFATVASRFATNHWPPGVAFIGALGGLIVLVPGYTLTVAMNEIAHRHLVSGTARVTGALVTFLQMGLGLALGSRISDSLFQCSQLLRLCQFHVGLLVVGGVGIDRVHRLVSRPLARCVCDFDWFVHCAVGVTIWHAVFGPRHWSRPQRVVAWVFQQRGRSV